MTIFDWITFNSRSDEQKRKAEQEFKKHLERQKELKEFGDFKDDLFDVSFFLKFHKVNKIQLIREIGRGNGGSVELVTHKKAQIQMARKIIVLEVNDDIRRQIIRELKVLGTSSLFTWFMLFTWFFKV